MASTARPSGGTADVEERPVTRREVHGTLTDALAPPPPRGSSRDRPRRGRRSGVRLVAAQHEHHQDRRLDAIGTDRPARPRRCRQHAPHRVGHPRGRGQRQQRARHRGRASTPTPTCSCTCPQIAPRPPSCRSPATRWRPAPPECSPTAPGGGVGSAAVEPELRLGRRRLPHPHGRGQHRDVRRPLRRRGLPRFQHDGRRARRGRGVHSGRRSRTRTRACTHSPGGTPSTGEQALHTCAPASRSVTGPTWGASSASRRSCHR